MYIQTETGEGVVAYHVMNLTPEEMRTIVSMDKKVADILITHHPEYKGNKEYLSDADLFKLRGILWAFGQYATSHDQNTFDATADELREQFKKSHVDATSAKKPEEKPCGTL